MSWHQFAMKLGALDPDIVEAIFERCGAVSTALTDAGDNPVLEPRPGETPLWSDTRISGLFAADTDLDDLEAKLLSELNLSELPEHHIDKLPDRVWEREWLRDLGPICFGRRLWICPTGSSITADQAIVIDMDPGLAFGTGTHVTTALCLEWLDAQPLSGKTMLDYGCGSGILAIAGLKLGCTAATAMDIDPQALQATHQNATNNAVSENLQILGTADEIPGRFDVVVANILAGPLVELAESITLTLRRDGMLTMSGVLCEQAGDVMAAYERWIDFEAPEFKAQDGQIWSRLTGKRRAG